MRLADSLLFSIWYALFPLWLVAGLGDWLCHRSTRIERTSGHEESALHVAQAAQLAPALLAVLFLDIDALVLTIATVCVIVHTVTAYIDIRFTIGKRHITATEQLIHAVLLSVPAGAVLIAWLIYAPDLGARESWALRWKAQPVPPLHLALILGSTALLNLAPLAEEFLRTRGTRRERSASSPAPGCIPS